MEKLLLLFLGIYLVIIPNRRVHSSVLIRKELMACNPITELNSAGQIQPPSNLTTCSKKLSISLKLIQDEKTPMQGKHQFVVVDSAYDMATKEEVRLMQPLVIKVIQQPATLAYPFKYLFAANNKPYEIIMNKKLEANYTGCDPQAVYQPTCQKFEKLAPNMGRNGKVITQGFCCPCDPANANNPRENLACKGVGSVKEGIDEQGTVHCLRFDPIWYSVNLLKAPIFHHKVGVDVYIQDGYIEGQRKWKSLLGRNSKFVVGTHNKAYRHSMITGAYSEKSTVPNDAKFPLDHKNHVLLIPQPFLSNDDYVPPQTKQSPSQFLVVNKTMVDQTGETCNKIGVSYGAFDKQINRCHSPLNSCLKNQIQELWLNDMKSTAKGGRKKHFLGAFGNLSEPAVIEEPNSNPLLLFDVSFSHLSYVHIELNADLIETIADVRGEIVEAVSLSDGSTTEMEVHVHNLGIVTAIFTTQVVNCASSLQPGQDMQHTASIGPYGSTTFLFTLKHGQNHGLQISTCTVELINRNGLKIAERKVSYQAMHRCFCVAHCGCKCTSESDWQVCHVMKEVEDAAAGITDTKRHPPNEDAADRFRFGFEFAIMAVLILLFLGLLKHLLRLWREYSAEGQSFRPYRKDERVKRFCIDVWFFLYCPFWLCLVCVRQCIRKFGNKDTNKDIVKPEKKISEVFLTTKEDTGVYVISESEDEVPMPKSQPSSFQSFGQEVALISKARSTSSARNVGAIASQPSLDNSGLDPENENNSRRKVSSSLVVGADKTPMKAISESAEELPEKKVLQDEAQSMTHGIKNSSVTGIQSEMSSEGATNSNIDLENPEKDPDEESLFGADFETLNVLSERGTLVYYNHTAVNKRLKKSGDTFSLCGSLRKAGLFYKFSLGPNNLQIFWNKKGKRKKLTTPLPINGKYFLQVLTGQQALQVITLEPKYPCLNYVSP